MLRPRGALLLTLSAILLAAVLRVGSHDWDQGQRLNPDEHIVTRATVERVNWPPGTTLAALLDPTHSPLNPRVGGIQFHYGTAPIYLTRLVTSSLGALTHNPAWTEYAATQQTGRVLAGLADTLTVLLVFLLGWRVWGVGVGLAAAALYALAILPIQLGHFYIVESFATFFMTAVLLATLGYWQTQRAGWLALAGLLVGLAVACKFSAAVVGIVPLLVGVGGWGRKDSGFRIPDFGGRVRLLVLLGLAAFLGLCLGDPFAVLDAPTYAAQLGDQARFQSGAADVFFTRRYVGTWPGLYDLWQLVLLGAGPLVGVVGLAGAGMVGWRVARHRRQVPALLLLLGAGVYFISVAFLEAKWIRYLHPLVPTLCLFAAVVGVRLGEWGGWKRLARWGTGVRYAPLAILLLSAAGGAAAWSAIYTVPHTRVQASRWVYAGVPTGARLGLEVHDEPLPLPVDGHTRPDQEYRLLPFDILADLPGPEAAAALQEQLRTVDYLIVSSTRQSRTVVQLPWRYPVQIRYYSLLFAGQLGFTPVYHATAYPTLFGLQFPDDGPWVDLSFTEYDHPPVWVFQKQRDLTEDEWAALFAAAVAQPAVATRRAP